MSAERSRRISPEEKVALRDEWLAELYTPEGVTIWLKHAEKNRWDIDYQLQRLEQLITGAFA